MSTEFSQIETEQQCMMAQKCLTLLDDDQAEYTEVGVHDASSYGLPPPLSRTPGSVARVSLAQQETDTSCGQDTLLHGESLFVISTSNPYNVSLKSRDRHSFMDPYINDEDFLYG